MNQSMTDENKTENSIIERRIKELGEKSSQILLFLSFGIIAVVTLKNNTEQINSPLLENVLYWWKWALFPTLAGILPLKEISFENPRWYRILRWIKVGLLCSAIIFISFGLWQFTRIS